MDNDHKLLDQSRLLISRLERLSADSVWAHRASGLRGALLKALDVWEKNPESRDARAYGQLQTLIDYGFRLVENAAKELIR